MSLEIAEGMIPHRDIFVHKTPGAALLGATGAWLAPRLADASPLTGTVAIYLLLGALGPALLYAICRPRMGIIGALAAAALMVSFDQWPVAVFEVVRPKVAMVTLGLASILAAERKRSLTSGLFATASVLCWQPGLCFAAGSAWALLSPIPRVGARTEDDRSRLYALASFLAGATALAFAFLAWLAFAGALADFFSQTVLFNLQYVRLKAITPATTVARLARILSWWDPFEAILAIVAMAALVGSVRGRRHLPPSLIVMGGVYTAMVFASLQGWPDTLPFVPLLAAIITAGFIGLGQWVHLPGLLTAALLLSAVWAGALPANVRMHPRVDLEAQGRFYRKLAEGIDPGSPVIAISLPEFLIHNGRRSAWKWPYMWNQVDRFAAAAYGGFDALFQELEHIDPAMIVVGRRWTGQGRRLFESWTKSRYLRQEYQYYPYSWPIVVYRKPADKASRREFKTRL